jgi:signal transduction histidine kinase
LNHLSKSLDADIIESYGLIHAVKYEIERWQRLTKNDIELSVIGELKFLNSNSELLIFRIIQESINNITKYAKAENIDISIFYTDINLRITITDDGVGFNPDTILTNKKIGQMAGLKNMRQRAESLEGKLIINSTPGKGTILEVLIPINNKLNDDDQSSIGGRSQAIA